MRNIRDANVDYVQEALKEIRDYGLKLTKQRRDLVTLLFTGGHRHVSAEELHLEALEHGMAISLTTVYNTLRCLYEIGLVNEIKVSNNSIFDTNCEDHAHILDESTGYIKDIHYSKDHIDKIKAECSLSYKLKGIDIIFKLESKRN